MKAIILFVTSCLVALTLTACDKGAKPTVKPETTTTTTTEQPAAPQKPAAPATEPAPTH